MEQVIVADIYGLCREFICASIKLEMLKEWRLKMKIISKDAIRYVKSHRRKESLAEKLLLGPRWWDYLGRQSRVESASHGLIAIDLDAKLLCYSRFVFLLFCNGPFNLVSIHHEPIHIAHFSDSDALPIEPYIFWSIFAELRPWVSTKRICCSFGRPHIFHQTKCIYRGCPSGVHPSDVKLFSAVNSDHAVETWRRMDWWQHPD